MAPPRTTPITEASDTKLSGACHVASSDNKGKISMTMRGGRWCRGFFRLVCFIGGVTFAEISALRFMGSQGGLDVNFVVMATKLINGTTLVKSLM